MNERIFIQTVFDIIQKASNAEGAAREVHALCRTAAVSWNMKPDIEVGIKPYLIGKGWIVSFEAGPEYWAVRATTNVSNPKVRAEAGYSFDIHFTAVQ